MSTSFEVRLVSDTSEFYSSYLGIVMSRFDSFHIIAKLWYYSYFMILGKKNERDT